jgi:hypothetical protein
MTEVKRISIFAICVVTVEEQENNQFAIVKQHSQHDGKPF